ncbi:hypothetical protein Tco_1532157 [Tanacetum coccineum]
MRKPLTRSLNMYKEYLAEFWYSTKDIENSKVSFSIPTGGIFGEVGVNTFRNAIGAHYLSHSSEYVAPPSIDVVRQWFPTIGYREEVLAKGTFRKSLLPTRWRLLIAQIIQCLWGCDALVDSTAEADPGLSAPNDSIPQQQNMDEGTKNTSYDHIFAGTDPHVLADQIQYVREGWKMSSQIQELTNQVLILQSQKHKLDLRRIKLKLKLLSLKLKPPFLMWNSSMSYCSSQPEGEHIKEDKVKKDLYSGEAEKESTDSDSDDETHVLRRLGSIFSVAKLRRVVSLLEGLQEFKFEKDNTPIVIQPPYYSVSKNTLAEYMILSSADNRPPMLDKDLYDSWKSIMELYMQNREHRRMILESVENGPLIWPTIEENGVTRTKKYVELFAAKKIQADCDMKATNIILQGLPADIYSLVNHYRVAKDLWERVQLLMQVSTQPMTESPLVDSGFAIPVFSLGDDPFACLNKGMVFITDVASSRFPSTNNQLRNSSNPRNHATIQDGKVTVI